MNLVRLRGDIEGLWTKIKHLNIRQKASNVMAVMLILTFMPSPAISQKKADTWVAELKIDTNERSVLKSEEKISINIEVSESEYQRKIREKIEKERAERERIAREQAEKARAEEESRKAKLVETAKAVPRVSQEEASGNYRGIYQSAGAHYGVPWQVIEAVHQVETGKSGSTGVSSYAGAKGPMQFLPSTWRHYGIDGDGDGDREITNVTDAIYGAANYLAAGGASEGRIRDALFNYNHSNAYVNKVLGIAREIGYNG